MKRPFSIAAQFGLARGLAFLVITLLPVETCLSNTQQIIQLIQMCKADSRQSPSTSCSICHTSSSQAQLSDKGQLFKSNVTANPEQVFANFCPLKASGSSAARAKPVLMVSDPITAVANIGTVSFSATDSQGARLKLVVTGQPQGMQLQQKRASAGTYTGILSWPKKAKPAQPGTYNLTVSATQTSGSPRLTSSTSTHLIVVSPSP